MDILKNLTKDEKESLTASLGVMIMTVLIGFWVPLTYILMTSAIPIIFISFIMVAYSAVVTYLSKFVVLVFKTKKEDIPPLPVNIPIAKSTPEE